MDTELAQQLAQQAQETYSAIAAAREQQEYRRIIADHRLRGQLETGKAQDEELPQHTPIDDLLVVSDQPDFQDGSRLKTALDSLVARPRHQGEDAV